MHPKFTYEFRINLKTTDPVIGKEIKAKLKDWLRTNGVDAYVEGILDVEVNHDYENPDRDFYDEFSGDLSPLSVFRYDKDELTTLESSLHQDHPEAFETSIVESETQIWMDGWKESFVPFETEKFRVRPPWYEKEGDKIDLLIEPGMAFGTGQHATTKLCLGLLESLPEEKIKGINVLDVGTGTGILAIGAMGLGAKSSLATDIEADAVSATLENARMNQCEIAVRKDSVPDGAKCELVFANILTVVLRKIMADLSGAVLPGGVLILSGILAEEADELGALAQKNELVFKEKRELDGWVGLLLEKPR